MSETQNYQKELDTYVLSETRLDDDTDQAQARPPQIDSSPKLRGTGHQIELQYAPEFYAKGAEQLVYKIPGHPDIVIKAQIAPMRHVISMIEAANPNADVEMKILQYGKEINAQANNRHKELRDHFGKHVLPQRCIFMKVPVTQGILNRVYPNSRTLPNIYETWTLVTIQRYADAVTWNGKLGVQCGYVEREDLQGKSEHEIGTKCEEYKRVTDHLVFQKNPHQKLGIEEFLGVQKHPSLRMLIERSNQDSNLRFALTRFLVDMIKFTNETDEFIDLAGRDNVLFHQNDGVWTYTLIDPLVSQGKIIRRVRSAISNNIIDATSRRLLLHILNYIRTVNGLAEQLSIKERVDVMYGAQCREGGLEF
jgi:hypothetical protein